MVEEGKILLKRSDVSGKTPTAEQLDYGELAVNYADGSEALFFKNSKDNLIQFDPLRKEDVLQIGSNNLSNEQKKSVRESIGLENVDNISLVKYTEARGDNLITNGNGNMMSNYNFPGAIFDPINVNNCAGSFRLYNLWKQVNCTEKISIDLSSKYKFSWDVQFDQTGITRTAWAYLNCFDIDDNEITIKCVIYIPNTLTTLAKDLNPGDTTVFLEDVSNFIASEQYYRRGFIFWNYKNSFGYQYPPETYSRNYASDLWSATDDSFKDVSANTITLDKPWAYNTYPAGTKLSQCDDANTYNYINYIHTYTYEGKTWKHAESTKLVIRPGTQKVSIGFLAQWNATIPTGLTTWIANITLSKYIPQDIDTEMSDTSENPVSNKAIKAYIDEQIAKLKT